MASTITTSVVTGGVNNHATVSSEANAYATDFVSQGVLGSISNTGGVAPSTGSFAVNQNTGADMAIKILGTGNTTSTYSTAYVTVTPASQDKQVLRARMSADYTGYTINANVSGVTQYDWIYLQASATNANAPSAGADNVITLVTSRSTSNNTDNGTPPTYGILLAVVTVANGASAITNANISDRRTQVVFNTGGGASNTGWTTLANTPNTVTYNGNRSYSLVFNSVDLTGTLSPGMRIQTARTSPAPTQCTSLNGTTQYYSRASASVAGMTFTNNFVVSAWIKLSSYAAGTIASRYNGTSGWTFVINASGQIQLSGYNAGAGNTKNVTSYQSLPLNKWVHVAAQLDMTSSTISPTVNYILIDGIDSPAIQNTAGTNPVSLIQAGNLEIGSQNSGTVLFPGKIAQVAIYSAKVTEAVVRASITQTLVGTETSLISAYTFNNSLNDLNANANNLTANGAAVATNADSPFAQNASGVPGGTNDYSIVTAISFSTNTTLTVQCPEGSTIPTSGGVNLVNYSLQKVPYQFPTSKSKWRVEVIKTSRDTQSAPTPGTWYNMTTLSGTTGGNVITIPIGDWTYGYNVSPFVTRTTSGTSMSNVTLSTANNTESDIDLTSIIYNTAAVSGTVDILVTVTREKGLSISSQTPYYLNSKTTTAGIGSINFASDLAAGKIYADPAGL